MRKGFTLLELLIVIIIIGILAVFALPQFFSTATRAKEAKAKQVLGEIRSAEMIIKGLTGNYSSAAAGGNISAQIDGKDAIRLTIPSGDPYYSYSAGATAATATANATNCGGCESPYTINYDTGVIS